MKVITGGLGAIGTALCKRLLKEDDVCIIDSLITCNNDNRTVLQHAEKYGHSLIIINDDICNVNDIDIDFDQLYNLACPAYSAMYLKEPMYTLRTCTMGLFNMIHICKRHNAKMLLSSSYSIYGSPNVNPVHEGYLGYTDTIGTCSCYIEGKRCAESILVNSDIKFAIARIFNTYSKYSSISDNRVIPTFIRNAKNGKPLVIYGTGIHTRTYTYVEDTVDGMIALMNNDYTHPVNIGNDTTEISSLQLANKVIELTHSRSNIKFMPDDGTDSWWCRPNIALAKEILHWEPKVSLTEGLNLII
jgi:UDP-glucuronate decarboxylase